MQKICLVEDVLYEIFVINPPPLIARAHKKSVCILECLRLSYERAHGIFSMEMDFIEQEMKEIFNRIPRPSGDSEGAFPSQDE